jgi:hypothetical protein
MTANPLSGVEANAIAKPMNGIVQPAAVVRPGGVVRPAGIAAPGTVAVAAGASQAQAIRAKYPGKGTEILLKMFAEGKVAIPGPGCRQVSVENSVDGFKATDPKEFWDRILAACGEAGATAKNITAYEKTGSTAIDHDESGNRVIYFEITISDTDADADRRPVKVTCFSGNGADTLVGWIYPTEEVATAYFLSYNENHGKANPVGTDDGAVDIADGAIRDGAYVTIETGNMFDCE